MIIGIGVDVVKIGRIEYMLNKHGNRFLYKVFSCEIGKRFHAKPETIAGWFAAKEAFLKAMGIGLGKMSLASICVNYDTKGRPYIVNDVIKSNWRVHLSITHDSGLAMAFVVIEEV